MVMICLSCDRSQAINGGCRGSCLCLESNVDITVAAKRPCPLEKHDGSPPKSPSQSETINLWPEIHQRVTVDAAFLSGIASRLPDGCGCVAHYTAYLAEHPPAIASLADYRRWTWELHNAVNVRLGKPVVSYEDAVARWGW